MGSAPWKQARLEHWEDQFSGEPVKVSNPGAIYDRDDNRLSLEVVEGRFIGTGTYGYRPCIYVHVRPDMKVRDTGYFDHELAIILERAMTVEAA